MKKTYIMQVEFDHEAELLRNACGANIERILKVFDGVFGDNDQELSLSEILEKALDSGELEGGDIVYLFMKGFSDMQSEVTKKLLSDLFGGINE
jgi:hypothetical protein